MRHASVATLELLAPLLAPLRALPGLTEKSPGVFYRKGRAFLHFHEDPRGLFADLRDAADRTDITSDAGRIKLLATARERLGVRA